MCIRDRAQEVVLENKEEDSNALVLENEHKEEISNGLENFNIEDDTPELFNPEESVENENNDQQFSSFAEKKEEDDLEIPAFLRRQKN